MKIAIIGSGISGLTCAYLLHKKHTITVFEKEPQIGGHTATKKVTVNDQNYFIDTGFIVFNDWTYPNFIRLLSELGIDSQPTNMSFAVSNQTTGLEYSGSSLNTLFAQRKNLLSFSHWKMLKDIVRFNKQSLLDYDSQRLDESISLKEYLTQHRFSDVFKHNYLNPMGSAIWSTSLTKIEEMPALFFIRFFKNHGLLSLKNRPQWRVLKGGSHAYLKPISKAFYNQIQINSKIKRISRHLNNVCIHHQDGSQETFDQVIFACHSDEALNLLADPSHNEKTILEAIPYQSSEVILHTDTSLLPKTKATWSSWNYFLHKKAEQQPILSYNMNILQGIQSEETFVVSLNATDHINPNKILGTYHYSHPQFSEASVKAQSQWSLINGVNHSWFCGAYWRNGFHEDGCVSALKVANKLGAQWVIENE